MVGIIEVHGSWLMTGKSLVPIAPLIGKKIEDIGGAGAAVAAAAVGQVTTVVPLNLGFQRYPTIKRLFYMHRIVTNSDNVLKNILLC